MGFGSRLRAARIERGYTGESLGKALADAMGRPTAFKKQTIANWEADRNYPDPDQIAHLCSILRVSADHLLRGDAPQLSANALLLARRYDSMTLTDRGKLRAIVDITLPSGPREFRDDTWIDEQPEEQNKRRFLE
jgi:transcriptional regulator with XRE-family HTH domain